MSVYVSNIVIEQGFDFETNFILEDSRTNALINLTGYIVESQIRKTYTASTAVSLAATTINPTQGEVRISLGSTITTTLKEGRYVYDVKATTGTGDVLELVEGAALVRPGVTR